MKTKGLCWGCGLSIEGTKHYHEGACRQLNTQKKNRDKNARVRKQSAALDGGGRGRNNKDLATRLRALTIRSHGEVGAMMGISAEGVRIIELRALEKIRKFLMPFKNAKSGIEKVLQITKPIPSLSD